VRVEPGSGVPAVAVDRGLEIDLADALEHTDEERVDGDGDDGAGVRRLDVALAELRAETFQQPDLLVGERELALGRRLLRIPPGAATLI
jgi:hypothetical protein